VFNITLTTDEKKILANWMTFYWLQREINDIKALSNFLNDTDFRTFSSANLLKEKSAYLNSLREIYSQRMTQYGLKNVDWTSWQSGEFDP
jgi:hypothetical protein